MKLHEIYTGTDMVNMDDDDRSNEIKNPLPNVLSSDDPLFGDAYDAFDAAEEEYLIKTMGHEEYKKLKGREYNSALLYARTKISQTKTLPIKSIFSTEPTVDPIHIDNLKQGKTKSKGMPTVVKYQNHNIVIDGNHRVIADYMQGKKDISIIYIDLDALALNRN